MNNVQRTTICESRVTSDQRRGFTLIEIVVAIGLMVIVVLFAGSIFKAGIGSYRAAMAQAEIMQKLRLITQQLDSDFRGLQKDGYLILYSTVINRKEHSSDTSTGIFRMDRIYFFCTGDFQSWFYPDVKSNIARIYFGHEWWSLSDTTIPLDHCRLARDALLLCPEANSPSGDVDNHSYAWSKVNPSAILADAALVPDVNLTSNPDTIRRLLCENTGQMVIDWSDGVSKDPNGAIAWFGYASPHGLAIEFSSPGLYTATWTPAVLQSLWPKALKFTFTLYDSRGVFRDGQKFTHIVYLGD
jgi:prepilin-type N-terminal cleavage/methylation domain-containing protein